MLVKYYICVVKEISLNLLGHIGPVVAHLTADQKVCGSNPTLA